PREKRDGVAGAQAQYPRGVMRGMLRQLDFDARSQRRRTVESRSHGGRRYASILTFRIEEIVMAATPSACNFGWPAPDFELTATDGKRYTRDRLRCPKGLLVMFICNHCPFVKAVLDKIVRDARDLEPHGIGSVAICSNDAAD